MYAEERRRAIADWVARHGRAAVTDLATQFEVTTETVRRDLNVLEDGGLIRRVHGGAVAAASLTVLEIGVAEREDQRAEEKDSIAAAALRFLPSSGGSVILDGGTTTGRLGVVLPADRDLAVLTNAIPLAARLAGRPKISLEVLGGQVRGVTHTAVGDTTTRALSRTKVDVAFMGANGVTANFGASTPDPAEAGTKRAMVAAARQVVVLADSSKFGAEHLHAFASSNEIDAIVTDPGADPRWVADLEACGVTVVIS